MHDSRFARLFLYVLCLGATSLPVAAQAPRAPHAESTADGRVHIPRALRLTRLATPLTPFSFRFYTSPAPLRAVPLHEFLDLDAAAGQRLASVPAGTAPAHASGPAAADAADAAAADAARADTTASALGVRVRGSGDFGGLWTRYRPCDPAVYLNCAGGALPQLRPDLQLSVEAGGVLSDRVHVDVDWDQAREFDAANNISIAYRGQPGELVQWAELGDVSMRLPQSRYLGRATPAGNFGVLAGGRMGPVDVQAVVARQTGELGRREFRLGTGPGRGAGVGAGTGIEQDATLVLDDADYVRGQFFFLADPSSYRGHPHVDALALLPGDAPADVRPAPGGSIELYRAERPAGGAGTLPGYFLADAVPAGGGLGHTATFRRLVPDVDYVMHPSGLWFMLRAALQPAEALAVAYVTAAGDTVGTLESRHTPGGTPPTLRLVRGPLSAHVPGSATWPLEMRQVYRLDGTGSVDANAVDLRVSLGELAGGRTFARVAGRQVTLLRLFGGDAGAPADRLDAARLFQPSGGAWGESGPWGGDAGLGTLPGIGGTYVVFPTLRPFAEPGPVPGEGLDASAVRAALGADLNPAIYEEPDPVARANAGRYRLNFTYRVRVEGSTTSFSLGAFGIREGSERLHVGDRLLVRDVDYVIDYDVGLVMLLREPHATGAAGTELRATWEQNALFDVVPANLFGASASLAGARGELNFMGMYRVEQSLMRRPQLGVEPGAALVAGATGRFELGGALLDRVLDGTLGRIAGGALTRPSSATVNAELAVSMPDPNRRGAAYLDDFEATDHLTLSARRQDWRLGSAPDSHEGDDGTLPPVLDAATAVSLVWQHDILHDGAVTGAVRPSRIDSRINAVGTELPEPVLWLTFGHPSGTSPPLPDPGHPRRWRSITTVLSATGHDLSRAEYLEFYVSASHAGSMALVLDIGTVGEDAFYMDALGNTSGVRDDGTRWGIGVLDEEAGAARGGVWGLEADRRGLWDQACLAEPLAAYPLGDARANCTRGNGINDTEDLDGNGVLDPDDGALFRFVVRLDQLSEYLVRDTAATGTDYRLYRVPLRSGTPLNGAADATWRSIRHLRLTVTGESTGARTLSLARMRIVGSRWTKRAGHGIVRGLLDSEPGTGAASSRLRVGPVSRLTDGTAYTPPPGVFDAPADAAAGFGPGYHEVNTRSLRIAYDDLMPDERAEVYYRYPQQPRNLLLYRELRLWVVAREGDWGEGGGEWFTVRVGTDPHNFYLFRTQLRPATGPRPATATDWLPELVIDFEEWWRLKAEAERRLMEQDIVDGPNPMGVDTVWSADRAYAVVLQDRARAPNLAAVRELAFAVHNSGGAPATGEVWIDELRVARPDRRPDAAGYISLDVAGGDIVDARLSLSNRGALFRMPGDEPGYHGGTDLSLAADARLDRMLPEAWAMNVPLSVMHTRNVQSPAFLDRSDVAADAFPGLRSAGGAATRIGMRISRRAPMGNRALGLLVDGTELSLGYSTTTHATMTSRWESASLSGGVAHRRDPAPRDVAAVPGVVAGALRALAPAPLAESPPFQRLLGSRLRWSPAAITVATTWDDRLDRSFLYERIVALPGDAVVPALESPRQRLRTSALLVLQPFQRLSAQLGMTSERDLLQPARATGRPLEQAALADARGRVAGMDVGWETSRFMHTNVAWRPDITDWLRVGFTEDGRYVTDRDAAFMERTTVGADTMARLQRRFEAARQQSRTVAVQPAGLAAALGADSASAIAGLAGRVELLDATWRTTTSSRFDRRLHAPGLRYQLGIGSEAAFRVVNGDTADRALHRDQRDLTARFVTSRNGRLELGHRHVDATGFDMRGGTHATRETAWPRANLTLRNMAPPDWLAGFVTSATASAGVQRIRRTQHHGPQDVSLAGAAAARTASELNFPVALILAARRGISISYRGAFSTGETLDPTGRAASGGYQHDVSLTGALQPPRSWRQRLDGPIILSFTYAEQQQRHCRFQPAIAFDDGCVAFLDMGTRNAGARVETRFGDFDAGMLLNFVGRRNAVGRREQSDGLHVSVYGRFDVSAGRR